MTTVSWNLVSGSPVAIPVSRARMLQGAASCRGLTATYQCGGRVFTQGNSVRGASLLNKGSFTFRAAPRTAVKRQVLMSAIPQKKILIMGGTRFIGVYLSRMLVDAGHEVTLLTRGKSEVTFQIPDDTYSSYAIFSRSVKHIKADRKDPNTMKRALAGADFDVVYDINIREAEEARILLDALEKDPEQYIFCSSAGVYLKSPQMPHKEEDAVDPKCRHKGKLDTEEFLREAGQNFTSIRPVYVYGPLNYNPVEEYFFHRIAAGRPICIPNSGLQVTQLGHVRDLARAFSMCLGNPKAYGQIFNIAGERFVTFAGLAKACAIAAGAPEPELVYYNPKDFDFGKKKAFPFRDQHFFASIHKAKAELDWEPEFGLIDGLRDSYEKDFGRGNFRKPADFETDDMILEAAKQKVAA